MEQRVITKQLAGTEDLTKGIGKVIQRRSTGNRSITKVNVSELQGVLTFEDMAALDSVVINDLGEDKTAIVDGAIYGYDGTAWVLKSPKDVTFLGGSMVFDTEAELYAYDRSLMGESKNAIVQGVDYQWNGVEWIDYKIPDATFLNGVITVDSIAALNAIDVDTLGDSKHALVDGFTYTYNTATNRWDKDYIPPKDATFLGGALVVDTVAQMNALNVADMGDSKHVIAAGLAYTWNGNTWVLDRIPAKDATFLGGAIYVDTQAEFDALDPNRLGASKKVWFGGRLYTWDGTSWESPVTSGFIRQQVGVRVGRIAATPVRGAYPAGIGGNTGGAQPGTITINVAAGDAYRIGYICPIRYAGTVRRPIVTNATMMNGAPIVYTIDNPLMGGVRTFICEAVVIARANGTITMRIVAAPATTDNLGFTIPSAYRDVWLSAYRL